MLKRKITLCVDLDGTLVYTDYANFMAYQDAIVEVIGEDLNLGFDPENRLTRDLLKVVLPNVEDTDIKRIIEVKEERFNNWLCVTEINLSLKTILEQNLKFGKNILITHAKRKRVYAVLKYYGLRYLFSEVLCFEDRGGLSNKYLHAVETLNINGKHTVVYENDQEQGYDAALSGISLQNIVIM